MVDISKGYIRLFRQVLEWEWYDNPAVKSIFFHCLFVANTKAKKWRDLTIKRGQLVTSYEKLAVANGLTIQQTRTALKQLQLTGEIEYESTKLYTIISVKNFNLYQCFEATNKQTGGQITQLQNTNDKSFKTIGTYPTNKQTGGQVTTTNNIDTNSYINISLSHEITEEERELLKKYVKENKLAKTSVTAYVNKIIKNGDHVEILKEIKKKQAKKTEQKNSIEKDYQKVKDQKTACTFALKHWGNGGENSLVQEILKKYNLQEYMTESQLYDYYHEKYNK